MMTVMRREHPLDLVREAVVVEVARQVSHARHQYVARIGTVGGFQGGLRDHQAAEARREPGRGAHEHRPR